MLCQNELHFLMLHNQICTLRPDDQLCRIFTAAFIGPGSPGRADFDF